VPAGRKDESNVEEAEREVEAALLRFYAAVETMISGGGVEPMKEAWHHTDQVTSRHPIDDWSIGWEAIWATWQFVSSFGRPDRGGSRVNSHRVFVYGDVAYAAVVYTASPAWGGEKINCTNILLKKDGAWKIVHHHADPSPAMQGALERMLAE